MYSFVCGESVEHMYGHSLSKYSGDCHFHFDLLVKVLQAEVTAVLDLTCQEIPKWD